MNEKGFIMGLAALGDSIKWVVAGILILVLLIVGIFFLLFAVDLILYLAFIGLAGGLVYAGIFIWDEPKTRFGAIGIAIVILLALIFMPKLGLLAFGG